MIPVEPFGGGKRMMLTSGAIGAAGLIATLVGYAFAPRPTLFSYEFSFVYWMSLGVGMVLLVASLNASRSRWSVVLRRPVEAMALSCLPLVLFFIPVALGMKQLFLWVDPPSTLGPHALELLHHKAPYLNVPFFLLRSIAYLGTWVAVALLLWRWSRAQDASGDPRLTRWQWTLSSASLPWMGLAISFAALDWVLSLEPLSYSTIYGFYFFSGGFLGALAVMAVVAAYAKGPNLPGELLRPAHFVSIGKLLLAMTAFWGYIAFCQYMLIWIADLPHEIPFYFSRSKPGWRGMMVFLAVGQFLFPFFALLSRRLKLKPRLLAGMGLWILFVHAFDVYWLVMPALHPDRPWWRWTDLTAFFGVGGVLVAFCTWALRGNYAVPVKDPYLRHSLRYDRI